MEYKAQRRVFLLQFQDDRRMKTKDKKDCMLSKRDAKIQVGISKTQK